MQERKPWKQIVWSVVVGILLLIAVTLFSLAIWYKQTFDISFNDLLFTMLSPLGGTGEGTLADVVDACALPIGFFLISYATMVVLLWGTLREKKLFRDVLTLFAVIALLLSIVYAVYAFRIPAYFAEKQTTSALYERDYVDPDKVAITDRDGNARNLIYIYLESMETTYASVEDGGMQDGVNYMPRLTALASENISFSDADGLGGFRSITGTGWTMGALLGTTSAVPFSLAVFGDQSHNSQGQDGTFLNGLTTLGDVLADKGYTQEFLCGSDARFAGRDTYFKVHGDYEIFDYYTAIERGYIDEDYYVFWGLEDKILFEIARDELTRLAAEEAPFNLTMLTVDLHHVGGYRCDLCGDAYDESLGNIVACQDKQIDDFLAWCRTQDFYEDTTIVIVGDHPRMDRELIAEELDIYDRPMYNCFINAVVMPQSETTQRTMTSLDLFPTTLAAMGFEIEGDRLGLGTNLFSTVPTLCESHGGGREGYDWLDNEVSQSSLYYVTHFIGKKK